MNSLKMRVNGARAKNRRSETETSMTWRKGEEHCGCRYAGYEQEMINERSQWNGDRSGDKYARTIEKEKNLKENKKKKHQKTSSGIKCQAQAEL